MDFADLVSPRGPGPVTGGRAPAASRLHPEELHPMRRCHVLIALVLLASAACASLRTGPEPGVIVVRNSSGVNVARAELASDAPGAGPYVRQGSVSPVPSGATQVIGRATDAPRLARRVELRWVEVTGLEHTARVDLAPVLRDSVGGRDEALVFELLPGGGLDTRLERRGGGTW